MEAGKKREEGYFLFCAVKNEERTFIKTLNNIALFGDSPTAPDFEEAKTDKFFINNVLTFETRAKARYFRRLVAEIFPKTKVMIAIRVRHPISMAFYPVWLGYGKYLFLWKFKEWLKSKLTPAKVYKAPA